MLTRRMTTLSLSREAVARGGDRHPLVGGRPPCRCPRQTRLPRRRWTKVQLLLCVHFRSVRAVSQDRPTVAIVDDEEPVRRALKRLMVSSGITVEAFASGAEFLDSLATRRPDCLVLDLNMPGLSGFDVQARLAQS